MSMGICLCFIQVKEDVRQIRAKLATQVYEAVVGCVVCDEDDHLLFDEITETIQSPARNIRRHKLTDYGEDWKRGDFSPDKCVPVMLGLSTSIPCLP